MSIVSSRIVANPFSKDFFEAEMQPIYLLQTQLRHAISKYGVGHIEVRYSGIQRV